MKKQVIDYLESLGFITISHKSSPRKIYFKDNITVTVEERKYKK